jgi:hypothetical protein
LPGTTTVLTIWRPFIRLATFSDARAISSSSASVAPAGATSRSTTFPLICTTSSISSVTSMLGSAAGQGCSHTRSPVISSYTSAPRCGANGKISEPAVATAKRSASGDSLDRPR